MFARFSLFYGLFYSALIIGIFAFAAPAKAEEDAPWQKWALAGLADKDMPHSMPDDLWAGTSVEDALLLIEETPSRFAHPVYRELFKNILLSEAEGFYLPADDKDDEDREKPAFKEQNLTADQARQLLSLRFKRLYDIGALHEAHKLYKAVFDGDIPPHEDFILIGLHALLIQGKLSAACLDVEALPEAHQKTPRIADLRLFCDRHFTKAANEESSQRESDNETPETTDSAGALAPSPEQDSVTYQELTTENNGSGFQIFKGLHVLLNDEAQLSPQAFDAFSPTEKMVAITLGKINVPDYAVFVDRNYTDIPSLTLSLLHVAGQASPAHSCIINESYYRGLISAETLLLHARGLAFAEASFKDGSMLRHSLPSCQQPAWYAQWIEKAPDSAAKEMRIKDTLAALRTNYPQLLPAFHEYLAELPPKELDGPERWGVVSALLKANTSPSREWRETAVQKTAESTLYVEPDWYLLVLESPEFFEVANYMAWLDTGLLTLPFEQGFDPIMPLSLLKNTLNLKKYQQAQKLHYEKVFPLTFSRNYVIYSNSLISRINASVQHEYTGKGVLLLLQILNGLSPESVYPGYMNSLMDILERIGYKYYARYLIVDTLSVGKK